MAEASITLISSWMGPLPSSLPLFLGGVRANPTISVLIPSDQPAPPHLPPNVRWLPMTLAEFSALASARLGVPLAVERGYKLCDFKPTCGTVFADEIGDAAFWGYCDLDLLFGDLRAFLTEAVLAGADVLTFRGEGWMSGPFSLYRTDSAATRLFEDAPEWVDTLSHPAYQGFDECGTRWGNMQPRSVTHCIDNGERVSLTDIVHTAAREGRIRLHVDNVLAEPGEAFEFEGHSGAITETTPGREGARLGVHFVHAKNNPAFQLDAWDRLPERFWITPIGTTRVPPQAKAKRWIEQATRHALATPQQGRRLAQRVAGRVRRTLSSLAPPRPR